MTNDIDLFAGSGALPSEVHISSEEERTLIDKFRAGKAGPIISLLRESGLLLAWSGEQSEMH